jgi:hypothetical protein
MQALYHLWYVDLPARRRFQLWTILIASAYGIFNSLVLGRMEKQVTWETLGVVCLLTVGFSALYCVRGQASKVALEPAEVPGARLSRRFFEVGLAATVVVAALSCAIQFPAGPVQAAAIDIRLGEALSSPRPVDSRMVTEVVSALHAATVNQVSISPRLVAVASRKFAAASKDNPEAWPGALALAGYRSSSIEKTPSFFVPGPCINVKGDEVGIVGHVEDLSMSGNCSQDLDHGEWRNIVFDNLTIIYHGGPTSLEHVQFKNCRFALDYTTNGQQLAEALLESNDGWVTLAEH